MLINNHTFDYTMKQFLGVILLVLVAELRNVYSAKVLIIFPSPAKSHNFLGQALGTGLAKRGHDVTMVSPYTVKNPPANYTEIMMGDLWQGFAGGAPINMFERPSDNKFIGIFFLYFIGGQLAEHAMADPAIEKLLKSKETYDVVITETFVNEAFFLFARHFNAQHIVFSPTNPNEWVYFLTGNPQPYAYVSSLTLDLGSQMTFLERAYNAFFCILADLVIHNYHIPRQDRIMRKYFPDAPYLGDYIAETNRLVLLNSHVSLKDPQPYVPNMIDIGGFHVDKPKPIPADLKKVLDSAKNGVIYFSMGSNLKGKDLPTHAREAILKAFGERKELILWKWEDPNLPGKPKNVIIQDWFPQSDLLAHPNIKLFITHGGLLSTMEAVSRGVPLLGIPIFGDQMQNMAQAVRLGYGLRMDYKTITYEIVKNNLEELLSNRKYAENAKHRSIILADQPMAPMDKADYWVKYVVKHKGAPHLRVRAMDLPWYKLQLVDVVSFYLVILLFILYVNYVVIKKVWGWFLGKKSPPTKKIKKN